MNIKISADNLTLINQIVIALSKIIAQRKKI